MRASLKNFMTQNLVVVRGSETIDTAIQLMKMHDVQHLPVVDDRDQIVGIIAARDLQRAYEVTTNEATVRDFMSFPVEVIDESYTLVATARHMITNKISSVIVIRDEAVVGLVTTEDLLRALIEEHRGGFEEMKEEMTAAIYNSPISGIMQTLANVGI